MKFIKYRNMIVKYIGLEELIKRVEGKAVLGKGYLEIIDNWCGICDYEISFVETDNCRILYQEKRVVLEGDLDAILSSTVVQCIIFLLYQKRNLYENIVGLHASALLKGKELIIFSGGKGSGKTSMAYLLSMKYDDVKLVANDYLEMRINDDETVTIVNSDYNSEITFRSHVLYDLDRKLYKKLTGNEENVFNQDIKTNVDFVDLKEETIKCEKVSWYYVGLGKTSKFGATKKDGIQLQIELYKELVQYLRGKVVVAIKSDRKTLADYYIDSNGFFGEAEGKRIFRIIDKIIKDDSFRIEWVRGQGTEIERYVMGASCVIQI